jgi:hypothetical protein
MQMQMNRSAMAFRGFSSNPFFKDAKEKEKDKDKDKEKEKIEYISLRRRVTIKFLSNPKVYISCLRKGRFCPSICGTTNLSNPS